MEEEEEIWEMAAAWIVKGLDTKRGTRILALTEEEAEAGKS